MIFSQIARHESIAAVRSRGKTDRIPLTFVFLPRWRSFLQLGPRKRVEREARKGRVGPEIRREQPAFWKFREGEVEVAVDTPRRRELDKIVAYTEGGGIEVSGFFSPGGNYV